MKNILGIIPARGNSKGLINKNILPILGKPVIAYTIEAALASKQLTETVVATNSKEIAAIAESYGVKAIMRPEEHCTDTAPIEWSLRHAVDEMASQGFKTDVAVWMQANIPVRDVTAIDRTIDVLIDSGADSAATVYEALPDFYALKKMELNHQIVPFENKDVKIFRRQDAQTYYLVDGAVVAINKDVLMSTKGKEGLHVFMGNDIRGVVQKKHFAIEIEEAIDLKMCEFFIQYLQETENISI